MANKFQYATFESKETQKKDDILDWAKKENERLAYKHEWERNARIKEVNDQLISQISGSREKSAVEMAVERVQRERSRIPIPNPYEIAPSEKTLALEAELLKQVQGKGKANERM